ncbi:MAG: hypothetical protein R3F43_04175 [bacterium]
MVLDYHSLPTRLLVFWLTAEGTAVHSVPVGAADLGTEVDHLPSASAPRATTMCRPPLASAGGCWTPSPPASPSGPGVRLLVIVPHGPLHPVPFEALPWAGRLLVDRFAVVTRPTSTAVATALRPVTATTPRLPPGHRGSPRQPARRP